MITVIKHGKETFKVTCTVCGCKFTYQAEDLTRDMFGNHNVICPDCHQVVPHDEPKKKGVTWNGRTTPYVGGWDGDQPYDCETCPNKPGSDTHIIGDIFPKDYKGGSYK